MRFLIADDHAIVRKGLAGVLREEFPSAEVIEVGDAESLFKTTLRGEWDLIISEKAQAARQKKQNCKNKTFPWQLDSPRTLS